MATFEVGVELVMRDGVSGPLGQLQGQMNQLNRGTQQASAGFSRLGSLFGALWATREVMRFGEAGVKAFADIFKAGESLQDAMVRLRLVTGANQTQLDEYGRLAENIQQKHLLSTVQALDLIGFMARTGVAPDAMASATEQAAKFTSVMQVREGMSQEDAARLATQFFTIRGAHSVSEQGQALDMLSRVSTAIGETQGGVQTLFDTYKRLAQTAELAGLSLTQQLEVAAVAQRAGITSSATLATDMMQFLTGGTSKQRRAGMAALGIHGGQPFASQLQTLMDDYDRMGAQKFGLAAEHAFGQRGVRDILKLVSPEGRASLATVRAAESGVGLDEASRQIMHSMPGQIGVLATDWESLIQNIGAGLQTELLPTVKMLNDALGKTSAFAARHPDIAAAIPLTLLGAGVGIITGGASAAVGLGLAAASSGMGTVAPIVIPTLVSAAGMGAAIGGGGGIAIAAAGGLRDSVIDAAGRSHGILPEGDYSHSIGLSAPGGLHSDQHPASGALRRAADALDRHHRRGGFNERALRIQGTASNGGAHQSGPSYNPTTRTGN